MASGSLGAEESREKPRWNENSKVYTRRFRQKKNAAASSQNTATATTGDEAATTTSASINNENEASQKDESTQNVDVNAVAETSAAQTPALQPPAAEDANTYQQQPQPNSPRIEVVSDDAPNLNQQDLNDQDTNVENESSLVEQQQQPHSPRIGVVSGATTSLNQQEEGILNDQDTNVGKESTLVEQQQPHSPRIEGVSGDTTTLNQQEEAPFNDNVVIESTSMKPVITRIDNNMVRISFSAARLKQEKRELKRKLVSELEQVKILKQKLQYKEAQLSRYSSELATGKVVLPGIGGRIHPHYSANVGSVGFYDSRPFQHPSVSVMDNTHHAVEVLEKEKRTPKANQYYKSSDFIYGTGKIPTAAESKKKSKSHGSKKRVGGGSAADKQIFKKCSSLLTKLMKHQYGWVFNTPVDVKNMGLHDYYDIIKHPMDLGTVKNRLSKNWYKSPLEFAEDVRLTFSNAMTYNPEGQDVHIMAVELSTIFEDRWVEIEEEYSSKLRLEAAAYDIVLPSPTLRRAPLPTYVSPTPPRFHVPPPPVYQETRHLGRSESFALSIESIPRPVYNPPTVKTPALKKPKAKDPDKRNMTYEEKQKLSSKLQALPPEKLDNIVQIIKKRNSSFAQNDDEIEVDIDHVDAETLWELDRFVTNYRKSLSKQKRKAELARQRAEAQQQMQLMNPVPSAAEASKETRADDTNAISQSSPVHERKEADDNSSGSSSGSSSSSSSSSDSGSSSSDSDSDSSSGSESNGG